MGFLSSLGSSAMSMASGMSLHDLTGGWSDYSSRKSSAKYEAELSSRLMGLQYQLNMQSLRESPSAYKAGLEDAGYNPMLAVTNGVPASSVGLGSGGHMPASDGSSKPFEGVAKMTRETAEKQLENLEKTGENIDANSAKALAEADESKARSLKVLKEAGSIAPEARHMHDYISAGKEVVAPIIQGAATAYGAKKGVEVATKIMKSSGIRNSAPIARQAVPLAVKSSAKSAALGLGASSIPAALAVSAGVLGKKAQDSARKNNTSSWRSYRSYTHHMSAGW